MRGHGVSGESARQLILGQVAVPIAIVASHSFSRLTLILGRDGHRKHLRRGSKAHQGQRFLVILDAEPGDQQFGDDRFVGSPAGGIVTSIAAISAAAPIRVALAPS